MNIFLHRIFLLVLGRIDYTQWIFLIFLAPVCPIHTSLEIGHKLQTIMFNCKKKTNNMTKFSFPRIYEFKHSFGQRQPH